jgi:hypothetical protein
MIALTNQHKNQQMMEVIRWGDGDDSNGLGWLIAREEERDSNDDQTMSANATTGTSKQLLT